MSNPLEKSSSAAVCHFSAFIRNQIGAILHIVKLLNENSVDILGMSVLDFSESGIIRIITSDPTRTKQLFEEHHIAYKMSAVLLVELPQSSADLSHVYSSLLMAEVSILFAYPLLIRPRGKSVLAVHPDDMDCAASILMSQRFKLLNQADISR